MSGAIKKFQGERETPGYSLFNDEDGPFWWKDCATSGCSNQVCTWLSNTLCHPCTTKTAAQTVKQADALES